MFKILVYSFFIWHFQDIKRTVVVFVYKTKFPFVNMISGIVQVSWAEYPKQKTIDKLILYDGMHK